MSEAPKRKNPLSLLLPADLETYLRQRAADGYRSISKEIAMRLEMSRQAEARQRDVKQ